MAEPVDDNKPAEPVDNKPAEPTIAPETQAEMDRRVTKALETQAAKLKTEFAKQLENEKAEAARIAKLTEDQKQAELQKQHELALAAKETELTRREMQLETLSILNQEGLPTDFADFVIGTDAETTAANITKLKAQFDKAVSASVDGKFKNQPPVAGKPTGSNTWQQQLAAAKTLPERLQIRDAAAKEGVVI